MAIQGWLVRIEVLGCYLVKVLGLDMKSRWSNSQKRNAGVFLFNLLSLLSMLRKKDNEGDRERERGEVCVVWLSGSQSLSLFQKL